MSKVVAIINKPKDCQKCVFGVCKFSHPFWSNNKPSTKGYYCQLQKVENRMVEEFEYDAEVHLTNCPLKPLPEKQELTFTEPGQDAITMGWNACIEAIEGGVK